MKHDVLVVDSENTALVVTPSEDLALVCQNGGEDISTNGFVNWDLEVDLKGHGGNVLELVKIFLFHEIEALVILMLLIREGLKTHTYDHKTFVCHAYR